MSYEVFKNSILGIVRKFDMGNARVFKRNGGFVARFSDGMEIMVNPTGLRATIRYGSGHQMQVPVSAITGLA